MPGTTRRSHGTSPQVQEQNEWYFLFDSDGRTAISSKPRFLGQTPAVSSRATLLTAGRRYLVEVLYVGNDVDEFEKTWNKSGRAKAIMKDREVNQDKKNGGYLDIWPCDSESEEEEVLEEEVLEEEVLEEEVLEEKVLEKEVLEEEVLEEEVLMQDDVLEEEGQGERGQKRKEKVNKKRKQDSNGQNKKQKKVTGKQDGPGTSPDDNIIIEASMESAANIENGQTSVIRGRSYLDALDKVQTAVVKQKLVQYENGVVTEPDTAHTCSTCGAMPRVEAEINHIREEQEKLWEAIKDVPNKLDTLINDVKNIAEKLQTHIETCTSSRTAATCNIPLPPSEVVHVAAPPAPIEPMVRDEDSTFTSISSPSLISVAMDLADVAICTTSEEILLPSFLTQTESLYSQSDSTITTMASLPPTSTSELHTDTRTALVHASTPVVSPNVHAFTQPIPKRIGVGSRKNMISIGCYKESFYSYGCTIPGFVVASTKELADDNLGNFATTLVFCLYSPEELKDKTVEGTNKGKEALSPRRKHAIQEKTMDTYKVSTTELTAKWKVCKSAINKKILRVFGSGRHDST